MKSLCYKDTVVWLIEDNRMDRDLALRAFAYHHFPHDIKLFRDGAEVLVAVNTWQAGDPLPGLVLLDLKLPKVNGFQVLKQLKAHPHLCVAPVIILSSSAQGADIQEAYQLGANSYLVKPIDFDSFLDMIGEVKRYWFGLNRKPFLD
ncbi:MAG: response regulator [Chloroflexi bacterium]|nr:response regulator [Chloroflexota bacterium]